MDKVIDHKALHDTFAALGKILPCRIATDPCGQSKGYGFVQFDNQESAQKAIEKFNGMVLIKYYKMTSKSLWAYSSEAGERVPPPVRNAIMSL